MAAGELRNVRGAVSKLEKVRFQIFTQVKLVCKNQANLTNLQTVITFVMRELNKQTLSGSVKKEIAMEIIMFILQELGEPDIQRQATATVVEQMLENVYQLG